MNRGDYAIASRCRARSSSDTRRPDRAVVAAGGNSDSKAGVEIEAVQGFGHRRHWQRTEP
jgi:hypothetical protein